MNPEQPSREQIETRLTALLLGELPADEAALLRYTMAQDPELQKLHDELQSTLKLVREAEKTPANAPMEKAALKLSADRRAKLLAHFKTPRPKPEPLFWLRPIVKVPRLIEVLVVGACVAILAAMLLPVLSSSKSRSFRASVTQTDILKGLQHRTWSGDNADRYPQQVATASGTPQPETVTVSPEPTLAPPPASPPVQIFLPQADQPQLADRSTTLTLSAGNGQFQYESSFGRSSTPANGAVVPGGAANTFPLSSSASFGSGSASDGNDAPRIGGTENASWNLGATLKGHYDDTQPKPTPAPTAGMDHFRELLADSAQEKTPQTASGKEAAGIPTTAEAPAPTASTLAQEGKVLYEMGKYSDAEKKLTQASTLDPHNGTAVIYRELAKQAESSRNEVVHDSDTQERMEHVEKQWILPRTATASGGSAPSSPNGNNGAVVGVVNAFAGAGGFRNTGSGGGGGGGGGYAISGAGAGSDKDIGTRFEAQNEPGESANLAPVVAMAPPITAGELPATLGVPPPPAASPAIIPNGFSSQDYTQRHELFRVPKKPQPQNVGSEFYRELKEEPAKQQTPLLADAPAVGSLFQDQPATPALTSPNASFKVSPNAFIGGLTKSDAEGLRYITNYAPEPTAASAPENRSPFVGRYAYVATNAIALNDGRQNGFAGGNFGGQPPMQRPSLRTQRQGSTPQIGGATSPTRRSPAEEMIQPGLIDFEGVELSQVLDIYAKLTNRKLLQAALPEGQIVLKNQSPLTKTEAIKELQAVLAVNGVSLVNIGDDSVKAVPSDQAGSMGGEIDRNGSTNLPTQGSCVTQVVQLKHVKPTEMAPVIRPFAALTNSILPIDNSGLLVLRDKPENVKRMIELIEAVDVSAPVEYISEVIPIHYAKLDDMASALNELSGKKIVGETKIIANESGSSLLIYATREDMFTVKQAIAKLDTPQVAQTDLPIRKQAPNTPIPQPEILTSSNAFSTFSLNVSDVSFKIAEASLQNGKLPDTASVRSEEFINAFDYRDPEAAAGQPMAFASERARYPFAQNRELLRFSIKTAAAGRQAGRALNLVLLLDNSGSMERADRVAIIREALRVLATQLQPQDTVSIVTFSRTARLWADGVSGEQAAETLDKVGGITPEGGTNLEEAMRLAYETARRHYLPAGMNRVVLLTDGAANLGNVDPSALKEKVEAQRKQGIALDCFGIGWEDLNDDLLEQLSSNGDGRYAFLNSPEEAATEFAAKLAGALQIAAADVKVQVEFNPRRVISYRQIGYAKHQLTKEQFRDNTVDAAEIAAQEAGNALYTIETNPNGDGPVATVHVRYKIPGTADYRERSWDVAYAGDAPALDQSSAAMRLAATASAFSEWLAASPYAQEVTLDELLRDLSGVPEIYGADTRPKRLETMLREAKSLEGK